MFDEVSDITREAIEERWAELGRIARAASGIEEAITGSPYVTRTPGIERALDEMSRSLAGGHAPDALAGDAAGYFDARVGESPDERDVQARSLAEELAGEVEAVSISLTVLRQGLQRQADELGVLADKVDAALG